MVKTFKGRILISGNIKGKAIVSREGLNPLAAWKDALVGKRKAICGDQNNKDLYRKVISKKIICLPNIIGSTSAGLIIQTATERGLGPLAFLFSKHIDSLAASGIILTDIWNGKKIITIDNLGDEFLNYVKDDMEITVNEDGTVSVI